MGLGRLFVLLLIAGAVSAGLWWTDSRPDQNTTLVEPLLGDRSLSDVQRMVLLYELDLQPIELERRAGNRFYVVEPLVDYASGAFLDSLFGAYQSALRKLVTPREEVTPEILERLELEPGRASFLAQWPDGKQIEIRFGGRGVFDSGISALIDGAVWEVSSALLTTIIGNVDDLREARVFRTTPEQAQRLTLTRRRDDGTEETWKFVRGGRGFELADRPEFELDPSAMLELLEAVLLLRVDRYVGGEAHVGGRLASLVVEVDGMLGSERCDVFVNDRGAMYGYAVPRGVEFFADPLRYAAIISLPLEQLRTRLLFPLEMLLELESLTIGAAFVDSAAGRILTLKRNQTQEFRMLSPAIAATNPTPVVELLSGLRKFVVQQYMADGAADPVKYGLDEGYTTLRIESVDPGYPPVELHIGDRDGEVSYVRRAGSGTVCAVSNEAIDPILRSWLVYVSLDVVRMKSPAAVRRIVCRVGDRATNWDRDEFGGWRIQGAEASDEDVADAFDEVRDLRGKEVLERDHIAAEGLEAVATFRFEDGTGRALHELELFRDLAGRPLIGWPESLMLFRARGAAGKALLAIVPKD